MSPSRRQYSPEFKKEAIGLADRIGFSKAGQELGVNAGIIRRWARSVAKWGIANPPSVDLEAEVRRLRKENGYLKKINEVLKKSTAIFSSDHIGDSK